MRRMDEHGRGKEVASRVAVDAHVHFHACFGVDRFLCHTLSNIRSGARSLGKIPEEALLLIAEMGNGPKFSDLADALARSSLVKPEIAASGRALRIDTGAPPRLLLLRGRQIQTREKLEILTVDAGGATEDGEPFRESLEGVVEGEGVAILPWAFGKWTGARERRILDAMDRHPTGTLHFGDSGARCAGARLPRVLRRARDRGYPDVRGSDPLPFRGEVRRAGSYGFYLDGPIDLADPLRWFHDRLRGLRAPVETYGARTALPVFAFRQAALQLDGIFGSR
jgi:hypothetical protein